ncbi:MAG: methyltransferase domain-containing protein [Elusimicrobia bacterium]|nr:methyltransferase domain-containing protein [Elusimicrobiota bacterium]
MPNRDSNAERLLKEERFFDNLAEAQRDSWWGHATYAGRQRQRRRALLAVDFLSPVSEETKILEIGCGGGDFTVYLMEKLPVCNYFGIDISRNLLNIAQNRVTKRGVTFLKGDVENMGSDLGNFDAAIGASILHHLNVPKTLSVIYKILRPGGKIFFMEPNMRNPQIWLEKNVRFIGKIMQNTQDETAFYKSEMVNMLNKENFVDISVTPFDFMHPAIPKPLADFLDRLLRWPEKIPVIKEFGGSLLIKARKSA